MATRKVRQTPKPRLMNALAVVMNVPTSTARHILDSVMTVLQNELKRTKSGTLRIKVPGLTGMNDPGKVIQIVDEGPAKKRKSS